MLSLLWYLKPEGITHLIQVGGLLAICLIIFFETGLFALLPGDSLLVLCGIFAATVDPATGRALLPVWALLAVVPLCGVLGDQVGYWLGSWLGRKYIYSLKDKYLGPIPIFKQTYLRQTEGFYDRWGNFTIVAGRWVPFVRTFAPLIAGVVKMPFRTFITYNVIGAVSWVWSMILLGYGLQMGLQALIERFIPGFKVAAHIDKIAILVVFLSLLPILYTVWKERQGAALRGKGRRKPAARKKRRR